MSLVVYRIVHPPVIWGVEPHKSMNGARESGVRLPARETCFVKYFPAAGLLSSRSGKDTSYPYDYVRVVPDLLLACTAARNS
jgi:hypothetical protein